MRCPARWPARVLGCALVLTACAAPRKAISTGPEQPHQLSETQALLAIQEALVRAGALAERGFALTLSGRPFEADVRFGTPPFAIEWLSAEDRSAAGASLPTSTPTSPLQIAQCESDEGAVQMLVLDAAAYVYEANPLRVQRGAPGIEDAEMRVRHDVNDFVSYVRDQGGEP